MTAALDIVPRDLRFGIRDHADPRWLGGDHAGGALVDAFAIMLPEGERFFIRAMKGCLDQVEDPELRRHVQEFCAQEAFHTREHQGYNDALRSLGYAVDAQEGVARWFLGRFTSPLARLYVTCATEQATYALSRVMIERPEIMADAHPAYRRLWSWHALEEVEHSAVGLRVLKDVTRGVPAWKRYALRTGALIMMVTAMTAVALFYARRNLRASGGPSGWQLARAMLTRPGWLRHGLPIALAYLRPGYMGDNPGDAALVDKGRRRLAAELAAA